MALIVQQDSREKSNKKNHILKYFYDNRIKVVRNQLLCGDYTLLHKQDIVIDVKQDCLEIAANICGKDHRRLHDEVVRAQENGIKLIFLIEEPFSIDTLHLWKSPLRKSGKLKGQPFSQVKGETLAKSMLTMKERYGCEFQFCRKQDTGRRIIEILTQTQEQTK